MRQIVCGMSQSLLPILQTSQSTLLLKKRKEMREVDDSLELMKKDYKKRMDDCEERRVLFESKQAKMREQVLKFEKFIQENDAKRQRAEIKARQEKKLFEDKIRELNSFAEKIQKLEAEQNDLNSELSEFLVSVLCCAHCAQSARAATRSSWSALSRTETTDTVRAPTHWWCCSTF